MIGGDSNGQAARDLEKRTDKLYARTYEFLTKVDYSVQLIRKALSMMKKPYVAFSGGKDSTVMLHLTLQQYPDINVLYVDQGMEYPDTHDFVRKLWKDWNLNLSWETPEADMWDLYEKGAFLNPDKPTNQKILKVFGKLIFFDPIEKYSKRINADGFFMGLRAEESIKRKNNFKYKGDLYYRSNGQLTCCPLSEWTAKDIWAYISAKELPYNPLYDKTRFQDRNNIRLAPFGIGGVHNYTGSFVFMKYYYPGLWNKFVEKNPLAKKYV